MEIISLSPELNPKVNGNLRFEHVCAITLIFVDSWRIKKVIRHKKKRRRLLGVF